MTGKGQIKVAVNGYGVIGKRVADAVAVQADMDLIGQLQPHTPTRFVPVTMDEALAARADRTRLYQELKSELA